MDNTKKLKQSIVDVDNLGALGTVVLVCELKCIIEERIKILKEHPEYNTFFYGQKEAIKVLETMLNRIIQ
jgi:hypothetical protein